MYNLIASLLFILNFTFSTNTSIQLKDANFTKIAQGSHSNFVEKKNLVFTNNNELIDLYNTLNAGVTINYKKPTINFKQKQVIGLFMGAKKIEGYKIAVLNVAYNKDETIVSYYYMNPSTTTKTLDEMVISSPFYLAIINKTSNPVKFVMANC